jgi:hypothetical protein
MNTAAPPQNATFRQSVQPGANRAENLGMRFVLALPDGRQYALVIDARRALIGAGAHCEVRLDQDVAAPEHIEAVLDGGAIHLRALSAEPVPTMNGTPFSQGVWPAGGVLTIGPVRIAAEIIDLSDKKKRTNPFLLLALVPVFAAIGLVAYLNTRPVEAVVFPPPPPLFDEPIGRCPPQSPETVIPFAQERRRLALAERERSPFATRDALDAVPNFELAAACFRAAGASEEADASAAAAASLRRKEEEEYRVRRARLEHAYLDTDIDAMDRETRVLSAMVAHRSGPYVDWLNEVVRRVRMTKGQPKSMI